MYITLETDYAVRIMIYLIGAAGRVDAKKIAEETDVTLRFALKILRKLVGAGFVRSYKGIKGGYEYGRKAAADLSLYDVVTAIEGECMVSRCLNGTSGCIHGRMEHCKAHVAFGRVAEALKKEMRAVTFDTLL